MLCHDKNSDTEHDSLVERRSSKLPKNISERYASLLFRIHHRLLWIGRPTLRDLAGGEVSSEFSILLSVVRIRVGQSMNPNISLAERDSNLCTDRVICATFDSMRRLASQGMLILFACGLFSLPPTQAQDLKAFEKAITEFDLDNGLHFIVLERRQAPVISFRTLADVGSVDDPAGQTGMAHMFEHMAFKGTPTIGTKGHKQERQALAALERTYQELQAERGRGPRAGKDRLAELEKEFQQKVDEAAELANSDEYTRLIEENGGAGLNAGTALDYTLYFYSLPSNRAELWFYLESERFLNPVLRDFYKERDVVREERRLRIESSPIGKLLEAFFATAYQAHPYGRPGVGWASDIESLTATEAQRFFQRYYAPSNLTVAIAGDVDPNEMRRLAEAYFGRLPKGSSPPAVRTQEPPQEGERRIEVVSEAQPAIVMGYRKPSRQHPDRAVFDVIWSVLSEGRTSWLYQDLVRDKQVAVFAGGFRNIPGDKYASLFVFAALPSAGHTVEENEQAMYEVIDKIRKEKVDTDTLQMVKTKARASLIRGLNNNAGLAGALAENHVAYGDWRRLFRRLDEINDVTAEDVQRVAKEYFRRERRTVAYSVKPFAQEDPSGEE